MVQITHTARQRFVQVTLFDFAVPSLGLHLRGDVDLSVGRPYPNKYYVVACHRKSRKALDGLFLETCHPVSGFLTTTRWLVGDNDVVTHHVHYQVFDAEFEAVSDNAVAWYVWPGWSSRWTDWAKTFSPCHIEPAMEVVPRELTRPAPLLPLDEVNPQSGWIVERCQTFPVPTIECERLLQGEFGKRMPTLDSAFRPACQNKIS